MFLLLCGDLFSPQEILSQHMGYRKAREKVDSPAPKKLIFFRGLVISLFIFMHHDLIVFKSDGVSEGQFAQVLEKGKSRDLLWTSTNILLFRTASYQRFGDDVWGGFHVLTGHGNSCLRWVGDSPCNYSHCRHQTPPYQVCVWVSDSANV